MPCEKERKTGKDPQPGGVLRARPFWQACVLRYRRRQPAARQEPSVSRCSPPCGGSDGYGTRQDPFTGEERFHQGVDLACAEGTAVLAVREGVATAARRSDSYGVCLQLLHPDGTETLYAHLQYLYVRTGETVQAGQILGTAGQTGRATGAHLHFELRRQGTACDPSALLGLPDG